MSVVPVADAADSAVATAIERLTGGRSRLWVLERMEQVMGESSACEAGETYTYDVEGEVRGEKCVDRRVISTTDRYQIDAPESDQVLLTVGSSTVELLFKQHGDGWLMLQRERAASKADESIERELRYLPD